MAFTKGAGDSTKLASADKNDFIIHIKDEFDYHSCSKIADSIFDAVQYVYANLINNKLRLFLLHGTSNQIAFFCTSKADAKRKTPKNRIPPPQHAVKLAFGKPKSADSDKKYILGLLDGDKDKPEEKDPESKQESTKNVAFLENCKPESEDFFIDSKNEQDDFIKDMPLEALKKMPLWRRLTWNRNKMELAAKAKKDSRKGEAHDIYEDYSGSDEEFLEFIKQHKKFDPNADVRKMSAQQHIAWQM